MLKMCALCTLANQTNGLDDRYPCIFIYLYFALFYLVRSSRASGVDTFLVTTVEPFLFRTKFTCEGG